MHKPMAIQKRQKNRIIYKMGGKRKENMESKEVTADRRLHFQAMPAL